MFLVRQHLPIDQAIESLADAWTRYEAEDWINPLAYLLLKGIQEGT